jgi:hypothetical protein
MTTDGPIDWFDWYALVRNELREAIANEAIHPQGQAFCHEWLNELIHAAERNDHAECLRLEALIRERIAWELSLSERVVERV